MHKGSQKVGTQHCCSGQGSVLAEQQGKLRKRMLSCTQLEAILCMLLLACFRTTLQLLRQLGREAVKCIPSHDPCQQLASSSKKVNYTHAGAGLDAISNHT